MCKYHAILYKELEHLQILVYARGPETNLHMDTRLCLYNFYSVNINIWFARYY
jgi:hypothetical protein